MEKAFDGAWHHCLRAKPHDFHVPLWLVKVAQMFLLDCSCKVRMHDSLSEYRMMREHVPQGLSLSPLLYSMYTADLPKSEAVKTALYADDVAIYATSFHSKTAEAKIERYLNCLVLAYIEQHKIKINDSKTECKTFTKKQT